MLKQSVYDITSKNDKSLFGLYLNLSELNAYIVLKHISDKLDLTAPNGSKLENAKLLELLSKPKKELAKAEKAYEMINKHFPWLNTMLYSPEKNVEENLEGAMLHASEILIKMLKSLHILRNHFAHFQPNDQALDKWIEEEWLDILSSLNCCFDAAVRNVKEEKLKGHLDSTIEIHINHLRRRKKGTGKTTIPNPSFGYDFIVSKDVHVPNGNAIVFFTSLFLGKKDAVLFLNKIPGLKRTDSIWAKATLYVFSAFGAKVPRPVVSSTEDKTMLALDMIAELRKCPHELFSLLNGTDQEKFVVPYDDEDDEQGKIILKRYSDRFAYLALRFIDDNKLFTNIRFHIDLGKYYFKFYERPVVDGSTIDRAWSQDIKTFGRLSEIQREVREARDNQWTRFQRSPQENFNETKPYLSETTPHYHINDNQIGISFRDNRLPKITPGEKIKSQQPDAWLSIYSLPAIIFYGLNCGFDKVETLLRELRESQRRITRTTLESGNVSDELTERLAKLSNRSSNYEKDKCKAMLDDTQGKLRSLKRLIEMVSDKSNKPGKRKYKKIPYGKFADFLAKDFLALQRFDPAKNGSDKITSPDYNTLQASLALYGINKDKLPEIFEKCHLIGEDHHPFLANLNPQNHSSLISFYEAYLKEREKFLTNCIAQESYSHQCFRPTRQRYSSEERDIKTIISSIKDKPVNIPNSLFYDPIKKFVSSELPDLDIENSNTAFLINAWFIKKRKDNLQPCYSFDRSCPVKDKVKAYKSKSRNRSLNEIFSQLESASRYIDMKKIIKAIPDGEYEPQDLKGSLYNICKRYEKTEKTIRRYSIQDIILSMMSNKILDDVFASKNLLRLAELSPDNANEFQNPVEYSSTLEFTIQNNSKCKNFNEVVDNSILCFRNKDNGKVMLKCTLTSSTTKLKDLGKHKKYFYDRRLPNLLLRLNRETVSIGAIEKEFDRYNRVRLDAIIKIFELESEILKVAEFQQGSLVNFKQISDWIIERYPEYGEITDRIRIVRNAFLHNEFPFRLDGLCGSSDQLYADKMLSYINDKCDIIINSFKNKNSADEKH